MVPQKRQGELYSCSEGGGGFFCFCFVALVFISLVTVSDLYKVTPGIAQVCGIHCPDLCPGPVPRNMFALAEARPESLHSKP